MTTRTKRRSSRSPKGTGTGPGPGANGRKGTSHRPSSGVETDNVVEPAEAKRPPAPVQTAGAQKPPAAATTPDQVALPDAVSAPRREHVGADGIRISYYADGPESDRPLLLIHAINAAPSVWEVKPLFEHYRSSRQVYALDLPGFGFSDRRKQRYSPELYIRTITDFATRVIGKPVDVIALSLGCEFVAGAAIREPDRFTTLTMISPTGFSDRRLPNGQGQLAKWVHRLLSVPLWGQGLFKLLATRPSIRYFMRKSFVGEVPSEYIDYAYATAHQPGAHHAPLYFLSGQLFTTDGYDQLYAKVTQPVLVIHDRDPNVSFERLPALLGERPNWQEERITPSLGLPHWERLNETAAAIDRFWAGNSLESH